MQVAGDCRDEARGAGAGDPVPHGGPLLLQVLLVLRHPGHGVGDGARGGPLLGGDDGRQGRVARDLERDDAVDPLIRVGTVGGQRGGVRERGEVVLVGGGVDGRPLLRGEHLRPLHRGGAGSLGRSGPGPGQVGDRPGQGAAHDREGGLRLEPGGGPHREVDGGVGLRGEEGGTRVPVGGDPDRSRQAPGGGDQPVDGAALVPHGQALGEGPAQAEPVPAPRSGRVAALGDAVHHVAGGGGHRQPEGHGRVPVDLVRPPQHGVPRQAQDPGFRDGPPRGAGAAGVPRRCGGRLHLPDRAREPAGGEEREVGGRRLGRQREQVSGQDGRVEGRERHPPSLRGACYRRATTACPGRVPPGRTDAATDQTWVRWKFWKDRDAVGPRWPW